MFGGKRRRQEADYNVAVTMAQACVAVDEAAEQNGRMRLLLGRSLLGTLRCVDIGPHSKDLDQMTWHMVQQTLNMGPVNYEDAWAIGRDISIPVAQQFPTILGPLLTTSREDMPARYTEELAFLFGKDNANSLTLTERLICYHAGFTLTTIWEDCQGKPNKVIEERVSSAAYYEGLMLIIAARINRQGN